ncbi:MAG: acyl-CoA thioesterase [Rhodoferax sp.]|uniref:acyl-CoA thioesterase n=1 Tax=Rhodoferax sp. TaxID=50421 RepID=UPI00262D2C49|nr:acyl-CoA thioesterase [Rhodoferax sp.]MDD5336514.1 acyl-CoA thioesterase [Rhodoferax sp.]
MKIEIPEKKKLVYEMRIPIRWGDMDAMNHVNNTSYFRYLETCRIDWLSGIGCDFWGQSPNSPRQPAGSVSATHGVAAWTWGFAKLVSDPNNHEGPVIVNAFCNFYKQLEYPGEVLMKMFVSDPGRTTFESWGTMERADQPGVIYAAGGATTIWVDFSTQKAKTLPDWLRLLVS